MDLTRLTSLPSLLEETCRIVAESGEIIKRDIDAPKEISNKGRIDLVTKTDLAVEAFLKERLSRLLPEADFMAEESAESMEPGELTWIIDPVDGTTNFAHGLPLVGTSVGLWSGHEVVLGVVNVPVMGELYSAAKGQGAFLNGRPIRVSATDEAVQALVGTGFPYAIDRYADEILANLRQIMAHTQGMRRPGAASIDLAWVACGRFDGFYESGLKPWDVAAGWLLVEEAGGLVSRYDWRQKYHLGAPSILATNKRLHHALSSLLEESA